MSTRLLTSVVTFGLFAAIAAAVGTISASPPAQSPEETAPGTKPQIDSFDFLVAVLNDAYENETLTDAMSEHLAGLFVENLIAPATGETSDQVEQRLSSLEPFDTLLAVLTESREGGALTDTMSDLLSDTFIGKLIAPATGETQEEAELRLSSGLEAGSVVLDLPAGWSGSLAHSGGARIEVPEGATDEAATVGIEEVDVPDYVRRELAGEVYDFTVGDGKLGRPVTLNIPYELKEGQDPEDLVAVHWNEERREWEEIAGVVDEATRTVRVTASELSEYSVRSANSEACQVEEGDFQGEGEKRTIVSGGDGNISVGDAFRAKAVVRNDAASDLSNVYVVFYLRRANSGANIEEYRTEEKTISGNSAETFESEWFAVYQPLRYTVICEVKKDVFLSIDPVLSQNDDTFTAGEYWRPDDGGSDNISARLQSCEVVQEGDSLRAKAKGNFPKTGLLAGVGQHSRFSPIVTFRVLSDDGRTDSRFHHTAMDLVDSQGFKDASSNLFALDPGGYTLVCSLFRGSNVHTGVFRNATSLESLIRIAVSLVANPVSTIQELVLKLVIFNVVANNVENRGSTATFFTVDSSGNLNMSESEETNPEEPDDEEGNGTDTETMEPQLAEPTAGGTDRTSNIRAQVRLLSGQIEVERGEEAEIPVEITNTGDSRWTFQVGAYSYVKSRRGGTTESRISEMPLTLDAGESRTLTFYFSSTRLAPHGLKVVVFREFNTLVGLPEGVLAWKEYDRLIRVVEEGDETDLSLSVRAPSAVDAGQTLTYTIVVTNAGPDSEAKGVRVTSSLNHGAVFSSASGDDGVRCSGQSTVTCNFFVVETGNPEEVHVTVDVPRSAGGQLVNTASVSMVTDENIVDPNSSNDSVTLTTVVNPFPQSPDRPALVAFYNSTAGEDWTNNTNWLSDLPVGEWIGVGTDLNGRIISLSLPDNGLDGTIPPELGTLSELTYLDLASNRLTGSIPPDLGSLSELTVLSLGANQLSGSIPSELADIGGLQSIILRQNQFTGCVPEGLRDVPGNDYHLVELPFCDSLETPTEGTTTVTPPLAGSAKASFQDFFVIEHELDEFGDHDRECRIRLGSEYRLADWNDLKDYHASGGSIDQLVAGFNWIREQDWDTTVGGVRGLRVSRDGAERWSGSRRHYFVSRHDHEVPPYFGVHDGIDNHHLSLGSWYGVGGEALCYRTGELAVAPTPESLGRATLVTLYESADGTNWTNNTNWLSDRPLGEWHGVSTDESSRVTHILLDDNRLSGSIPSELGDLSSLTTLHLNGNSLAGRVPPELGNLVNLTDLRLQGNRLSGPITSELRRLSNLTVLELGDNQLSGPIPFELGNLANLTDLYLYDNRLSGTIPSDVGNLSNLEELLLGNNELSGEIPTELGSLSALTRLQLSGNQFTGCIPEGLDNVPENDLNDLGLPFCSGPEDRDVLAALYNSTDGANWTDSTNWLSEEPISEWYGVTTDDDGLVSELSLNRNGLTGAIPTELGTLSNLTNLSLWGNQLTGEMPTELGSLSNLTELFLSGNEFTGEIPSELGSLSNLTELFLSGNEFTGEIPSELGSLSNLTGLGLSSNRLTGEIPSELGNLSNLTGLRLHGNQFTGELPQSFTGLTALATLIFRDNSGLCAPIDQAFQTWLQSVTLVSGSSCAQDSLEDRAVLVDFYNATDGANWTNNTNWLSERPIREWHGVVNDADGRVSELLLFRNELTGDIPSELGNLSKLTQLVIFSNRLTGEIPTELGSLANLRILFLSDNQLTGELPQNFTGLTMLERLVFGGNAGLCAPANEEFQTWLQSVSIVSGDNCVPGDSAEDRAVLVEFYNSTGGANWTNNTNWLSDEPLGEWYGVSTDDEGRVTELNLGENRLSGTIPAHLGNLSNLKLLFLAGNQLTGIIPPELGSLSSLESLWLNGNQLSGSIPSELGSLSNLQLLNLRENQLSGLLPPELGNLSNLALLVLGTNQLSGPIPPELTKLSKLQVINLWQNQLSGSIPSELGNMDSLRQLGLFQNRLSGAIPSSLGNLANLTTLWLADNQLTGKIPTELGNLSNLQLLALSKNQLTGQIPTALGNLSNLTSLTLGNNQLSGEIPTSLGNLTNLTTLSLADNQLTGKTPTDLGNLVNLEQLWLNDNQLSGSIPTELGNLANLKGLHLNYNQLTGTIPMGLGNFSNLRILDLGGNQLNGAIPTQLGSLSNLERLWLGSNQLTGEMPTELGNLTNLLTMDVTDNQLTGELPLSLTRLTKLGELFFPENAGLCAPTDQAFQTWLQGVSEVRGDNCGGDPPTADAGPDQHAQPGDLVTLNGQGSSSGATYSWHLDYASSDCLPNCAALAIIVNAVTLSDPSSLNPTFTVPGLNGLANYRLHFELTVTRGGLSAKDCVEVFVNDSSNRDTFLC